MKAFWAPSRATARQFLGDRVAFLLPVLPSHLMAAFFGMIFSQPARCHLTLGLAVADDCPEAAAVLQALESPALAPTLSLRKGSHEELRQAVTQGDLALALLLPDDLSATAGAGRVPPPWAALPCRPP